MIEVGNFQIYENLEEYCDYCYAGRRAVLFIRNKELIKDCELEGKRYIHIRSLQNEIFSGFCLIQNYQEFMEEIRKEFSANPHIEICLIERDFPDYEIQDVNEFISYLLEQKDKKIE